MRQSTQLEVAEVIEDAIQAPEFIVARADPEFRACKGTAERIPGDGVRIEISVALALDVRVGDFVRIVRLRANASREEAK